MSDKIKGYLVTLESDIHEDYAKETENALKMIKGVFSVQPYVKGMEDDMLHERGQIQIIQELIEFLRERKVNKK